MSNLTTLHRGTKECHQKIEKLPYLNRYSIETVTLLDHYCHLRQLLPIYEALERKVKDEKFTFALPVELNETMNRSEKIKSDLDFLKQYIPAHIRQQDILRSTKDYVDHLDHLNVPDADTEIFSHFLVRILGDLFGGQKLKRYVQNCYTKEKIFSSHDPEKGVNFYVFEKNMLRKFSTWFNAQNINDEMAVLHANNAFNNFINIFKELEENRALFSRTHCCARFFSMSKAKQAVLIGAAIVPVAAAIYSYSK